MTQMTRWRIGLVLLLLGGLPGAALAQIPDQKKIITAPDGSVDVNVNAAGSLQVNCASGCSGGTSDTDDGTVAGSQSTGIAINLSYLWNGVTWARMTGDDANGLKVQCTAGCTPGGSFADNSAFTFGTTSINVNGFVFDDVAPNAATENRAAAPRMSGNRVPYSILRDAAGNERGANVNASNALLTAQTGELPAGTQNIGDVDVVSVVPGTGATNLGKAEDAQHSSGDVGVMSLAVRRAAATDFSNGATDNDYVPLQVNGLGSLRVVIEDPISAFTSDLALVTEDAVAGASPTGRMMMMVRDDALASNTTTDGDVVATRGTDKGELYVKHVDTVTVAATDLDIRDLTSTDTVTVVQGTGTNLHIVCDSGCGGAATFADDDAFTFGTTAINVSGFVFDDVAVNAATENSAAAPRMSGNRIPYSILRDAAGNERGVNVTAGFALTVDGSGVTQPISNASLTSIDGKLNEGAVLPATTADATVVREVPQVRASGNVTLDTLSETVGVELTGFSEIGVSWDAGTFAGTLVGECSNDGGSIYNLTLIRVNSGAAAASAVLTNPNSAATVDLTVFSSNTHCRLRVSAYTSGSLVARMYATNGPTNAWQTAFAPIGSLSSAFNWRLLMGGPDETGVVRSPCVTDHVTDVDDFCLGNREVTRGQTTASASIPVVWASDTALPAGTSNIGDVDVATIAAGDNNIGNVDIVTLPSVTIGTFPDNEPFNIAQMNGVAVSMGAGASGTGVQRVTLASDSPVPVSSFPDNEPFNVAQINGVTPLMGNGASGTGAQRVTLANDSTGVLATVTTVTTVTNLTNLPNEGQQTAANSISVTPDTDNDAVGTTGSAVPARTMQIGGTDGTNLATLYIDPCQREARTVHRVDIVTATTTEIAAATASEFYWVCSINLVTAAANNVMIVEDDSATNCPSPTAGVSSGGTTAAEGYNLAANSGIVVGVGSHWIMKTGTANRSFCIITSAATQLSGTITYVSAP